MLSIFSVVYLGFTVYAFRPVQPIPGYSLAPDGLVSWLVVYTGLMLLPLAAFMFPVPYTAALLLKAVGREPKTWVKTPRTGERRLAI